METKDILECSNKLDTLHESIRDCVDDLNTITEHESSIDITTDAVYRNVLRWLSHNTDKIEFTSNN